MKINLTSIFIYLKIFCLSMPITTFNSCHFSTTFFKICFVVSFFISVCYLHLSSISHRNTFQTTKKAIRDALIEGEKLICSLLQGDAWLNTVYISEVSSWLKLFDYSEMIVSCIGMKRL